MLARPADVAVPRVFWGRLPMAISGKQKGPVSCLLTGSMKLVAGAGLDL